MQQIFQYIMKSTQNDYHSIYIRLVSLNFDKANKFQVLAID